LLKKQILIF